MNLSAAEKARHFFARLGCAIDSEALVEYGIVDSSSNSTLSPPQNLPLVQLRAGSNGEYLRKAEKWLPLLRHIPGVRAVFVCNSVAFGTADQNSDIDILIVTAANRMWVARIFCTLFLQLLGLRRHGNKIAGRFCLSFFVSEAALDFEKIALQPHDPYLAFWVAALFPVFGQGVATKIADQNRAFVLRTIGAQIRFARALPAISECNSKLQNILEVLFGKRWNIFFKKIFLPRAMRKKAQLADSSGIILSDVMLKFHNNDRRRDFLLE